MVSFSHGGLTHLEQVIGTHRLHFNGVTVCFGLLLSCMWHCRGCCFLSSVSPPKELFFLIWSVTEHDVTWPEIKCLCMCVFVRQAEMMFSSGVFWMGLVFIPVTSLIFDVAYKVWVFSSLNTPTHIRHRKFLLNLSHCQKKFPPESLIKLPRNSSISIPSLLHVCFCPR